jgi:hypothetical protein
MEAKSVDLNLIRQCRAEFDAATANLPHSPDHTLLLSSEGFSGSVRRGYSNANHCAQILAGHTVIIVAYLRAQDSFMESLYTQQIHQGDAIPFADFLASLPPQSFDWHAHIQAFANSAV